MNSRASVFGRACWPTAVLTCLGSLLGGCQSSKSPDYACHELVRSIGEGDAVGVFELLTQPTRWALYTVQKNHARMWTLVQTHYPPKERRVALSRLYAAAAEDGRDLFALLYEERYAADFAARLGTGRLRITPGPTADVVFCGREGQAGAPFRLARDATWRFGLSELEAEWEQAQLRATHDLATVEKNAEIYRSAGRPVLPAPASTRPAPAGG